VAAPTPIAVISGAAGDEQGATRMALSGGFEEVADPGDVCGSDNPRRTLLSARSDDCLFTVKKE